MCLQIYNFGIGHRKVVNKKQKNEIFPCFIGFRKAFVCIWHERLFYKIIGLRVGGKTYDLIK